jgi:hypothetical protein
MIVVVSDGINIPVFPDGLGGGKVDPQISIMVFGDGCPALDKDTINEGNQKKSDHRRIFPRG